MLDIKLEVEEQVKDSEVTIKDVTGFYSPENKTGFHNSTTDITSVPSGEYRLIDGTIYELLLYNKFSGETTVVWNAMTQITATTEQPVYEDNFTPFNYSFKSDGYYTYTKVFIPFDATFDADKWDDPYDVYTCSNDGLTIWYYNDFSQKEIVKLKDLVDILDLDKLTTAFYEQVDLFNIANLTKCIIAKSEKYLEDKRNPCKNCHEGLRQQFLDLTELYMLYFVIYYETQQRCDYLKAQRYLELTMDCGSLCKEFQDNQKNELYKCNTCN